MDVDREAEIRKPESLTSSSHDNKFKICFLLPSAAVKWNSGVCERAHVEAGSPLPWDVIFPHMMLLAAIRVCLDAHFWDIKSFKYILANGSAAVAACGGRCRGGPAQIFKSNISALDSSDPL